VVEWDEKDKPGKCCTRFIDFRRKSQCDVSQSLSKFLPLNHARKKNAQARLSDTYHRNHTFNSDTVPFAGFEIVLPIHNRISRAI